MILSPVPAGLLLEPSRAGRFQAEIDTDMQDGSEAGVSGTPAFFINGRFLGGAQPIEAFQRIIDEELARAK
jgi:protein-disulfide isomerase